jgi:hypothetical protein
MRPLYESAENRAAQEALVTVLCDRWKCGHITMPQLSVADFLLHRDPYPKAWVEVKQRSNAMNAYVSYMLSFAKWKALRALSSATKLPAFLLIGFTNGAAFIEVDDSNHTIDRGGRVDRGDPLDLEGCIYIPMGQLERL